MRTFEVLASQIGLKRRGDAMWASMTMNEKGRYVHGYIGKKGKFT